MHQSIWAPWRMEYIQRAKSGDCFLCALLASNEDRENLVLKRGPFSTIIMNRYPYNGGHLMVIPNRHLADFEELTTDEQMAISTNTQIAIRILKTAITPDGFNLGYNLGSAAGAGLKEHLHQHIVPRWNGDTNFMPVVGETHVMPQSLLALYDQLKPHIDPCDSTH